jgi:hypothetical protein
MKDTIVGVDMAKNVTQIHWIGRDTSAEADDETR